MRAATFARQIGRTVPFALAAFRQAYAGGRALDVPDNVLIAAHRPARCTRPRVLRAVELRLGRRRCARDREAAAFGVRATPAVRVAGRVFHGDEGLQRAAEAAAATTAGHA